MAMSLRILVASCLAFVSLSAATEAEKVDLVLYYESLCPDCQLFIAKQLYPTFLKVGDILNLTLVPYGNAVEYKVGQRWRFECQHGHSECIGNMIETCAIHVLKNISVYFPYIHCCEKRFASSQGKDPRGSAAACAKELGVDFTPIEKCEGSDLGNELEHEMAVKTGALEPQHEYVPWVTLFGKHTDQIQKKAESNLLKLVCESYKGVKPPGCDTAPVNDGRCYRVL